MIGFGGLQAAALSLYFSALAVSFWRGCPLWNAFSCFKPSPAAGLPQIILRVTTQVNQYRIPNWKAPRLSLYWLLSARYPSGKGEVCKTFIRGFDSHPRLQTTSGNSAAYGCDKTKRDNFKRWNLSITDAFGIRYGFCERDGRSRSRILL